VTARKFSIAFLGLPLALVTGCGAEKPNPPRSICGIKVSAAAVAPLLPEEGEQVTVKRFESDIAPNACSVHVDGSYYFSVLQDPKRPGFDLSPGYYTSTEPRTFQGKLGIDRMDAIAAAHCPGKKPPVFAKITLSLDEMEGLYANSSDVLEKFMNAYMPALQKHYGCKTSR
jgi:hypothetical protein